MTSETLTPRQRLARIVAEETDGGRRVVRFFVSVTEGEQEEFKPHHRMDAAKELVKIGLEEFEDYIQANASTTRRRALKAKSTAASDTEVSPELQAARAELAQYAREITDGGRKTVRFYYEVMDGLRADEGFKPHHRIAAAQKLIAIGFGPEAELDSQPAAQSAPVVEARNAASGRLDPDSPPWTMYHPPVEDRESTGDVFSELLVPRSHGRRPERRACRMSLHGRRPGRRRIPGMCRERGWLPLRRPGVPRIQRRRQPKDREIRQARTRAAHGDHLRTDSGPRPLPSPPLPVRIRSLTTDDQKLKTDD